MAELVKLCSAVEVMEGDIKKALLPDGSEVALYRVEGAIYATSNRCTHGDATLSEMGILTGKTLECTFHSGTFDVTTGEATGMPCEVPLKTYPVKLIDGNVYVDVDVKVEV
jgi:p-cumate 2,3-dioxygenase ferredoxin subunit